jgi:hypothetical protein
MMLSNPGFYSVIAEMDGKVVVGNFLDERNPIAGIGPITVDPTVQNQTVGRQLNISDPESLKALFSSIGAFDAVANAAGDVFPGPFDTDHRPAMGELDKVQGDGPNQPSPGSAPIYR